jgi:cytochrome c-type biogenesis protein CcmE
MSAMKPKHQRLTLIGLAIVAVLGAVLLAMWGLADRAAYFRTPADIVAGKSADGAGKVPVTYRGILPDLFREGSGMVAEGRMVQGTFVADMILAKHDERYMPPQIGNQSAEHQAGKTLEQ